MNQDREDDVAVGAAVSSEPAALGTHAPSLSATKKAYRDLPPEPFVGDQGWLRWSFWRAGIAEFMSSLLFLYITIQTVMGHERFADPCNGVGTQGIAWAFGGIIFVLVYCTAGISGTSGSCWFPSVSLLFAEFQVVLLLLSIVWTY